MICQSCQKSIATVHVTEILEVPAGEGSPARKEVHELHLCEECAQATELPHVSVVKKSTLDIGLLLQMSSQQTRRKAGPACPSCGMTLEEFRKKGRLGCAKDYEVFKEHIGELLERVHGARAHVGRMPGESEADSARSQQLSALQQRLLEAIQSEAYESAARLRDEIRALGETSAG